MDDEKTGASQEPPSSAQEAWRQVGNQIKSLGESLTAALRFALNEESYQQHKQAIQQGFDQLVKEVSDTIQVNLQSNEAQQAKQEAEKFFQGIRNASELTINEIRPQLTAALRRLNSELDAIIEKLEQSASSSEPAEQPSNPDDLPST
jgi:hypothetical protein